MTIQEIYLKNLRAKLGYLDFIPYFCAIAELAQLVEQRIRNA